MGGVAWEEVDECVNNLPPRSQNEKVLFLKLILRFSLFVLPLR